MDVTNPVIRIERFSDEDIFESSLLRRIVSSGFKIPLVAVAGARSDYT